MKTLGEVIFVAILFGKSMAFALPNSMTYTCQNDKRQSFAVILTDESSITFRIRGALLAGSIVGKATRTDHPELSANQWHYSDLKDLILGTSLPNLGSIRVTFSAAGGTGSITEINLTDQDGRLLNTFDNCN